MKYLMIILIVGFITYGCRQKYPESMINAEGVIETIDSHVRREIKLYIIDSCEYIGHIEGYRSDFLTHKGNCKFCKARK